MKRFRITFPTPCKSAIRMLQWELPIILIWSVTLLICFLTDYQADPTGAAYHYPALLEYITASLVITLALAVVADLTERERNDE